MKNDIQTLKKLDLEILKAHYETVKFSHECALIYEKQVPNTGIILVEGELDLVRNKNHIELTSPGSILGIRHMLENLPFQFRCKVKQHSQLILLPKSDILKILNERESDLYHILKMQSA